MMYYKKTFIQIGFYHVDYPGPDWTGYFRLRHYGFWLRQRLEEWDMLRSTS